jgi:hypothetical protein
MPQFIPVSGDAPKMRKKAKAKPINNTENQPKS